MADPRDRFRELRADNDRLTAELAGTAEFSAAVHDFAAGVHDELGSATLLDPSALREHADRDRDFARQERERLHERDEPA